MVHKSDSDIPNDATSNDDEQAETPVTNDAKDTATADSALTACEEALRTMTEERQRERAEFLNAKKRLELQQQTTRERDTDAFVARLLPLCDSFHVAMSNQAAWDAIDESWRKGVEAIHQQLQRILGEYNVAAIDPQGESFDPERHEAVETIPVTEPAAADTVQKVIQLGYVRQVAEETRILRPARVGIGVAADPDTDDA